MVSTPQTRAVRCTARLPYARDRPPPAICAASQTHRAFYCTRTSTHSPAHAQSDAPLHFCLCRGTQRRCGGVIHNTAYTRSTAPRTPSRTRTFSRSHPWHMRTSRVPRGRHLSLDPHVQGRCARTAILTGNVATPGSTCRTFDDAPAYDHTADTAGRR